MKFSAGGQSYIINPRDLSLWGIVVSNVITIIMAYIQHWSLGEIMWIYWGQSVFIGLVNFYRMWNLKEFTTKGMTSNGRVVSETPGAQKSIAGFFLVHYGMFHFVYMIFLWQELALTELSNDQLAMIVFGIITFAAAHKFSFSYNSNKDFKDKKPNLGTIMFYPYLRIIPMHLTIIFGAMLPFAGIIIFMGLKTLADAGMHSVEHHLFQKK